VWRALGSRTPLPARIDRAGRGEEMSDIKRALEFIEAAERCATLSELQNLLTESLAAFGATQFTLMALAKNPNNGARSPLPLSEATSREWASRYGERRYFNSDAVIHTALRSSTPFAWTDLDIKQLSSSAKTVLNEGREILKMEACLVIPTHDAAGFAGFVSLFFPDEPPDQAMHKALKLMAIYALEKAKELQGVEPDKVGWDCACPLTARQRESIAFLAAGKTDWEIGAILGIAEKTANHHFEAAKRQLNVATRAQAVAVAVHRGWVTI